MTEPLSSLRQRERANIRREGEAAKRAAAKQARDDAELEQWLDGGPGPSPARKAKLRTEVARRVAEGRRQGFEDAKAEFLKRMPQEAAGAPDAAPPTAAHFHAGAGMPERPTEPEPGSVEAAAQQAQAAFEGRVYQLSYPRAYRHPPPTPATPPEPPEVIPELDAVPIQLAEEDSGD